MRQLPLSRTLPPTLTHLALLTACILGTGACTARNPAFSEIAPANAPEAPYVEGELVVRFPAGTTRAEVEARVSLWGAVVLESMVDDTDPGRESATGAAARDAAVTESLDGMMRLGLPAGMAIEQALSLFEVEGESLYAEPNYLVEAYKTPNDPRYGELWGMVRIDGPGAWERHTGSPEVLVAVIDTGLDYAHPDLVNRAWHNPGETAGNGVDDDHNGYVDDIYGWDFCNNDSNPMDDHGHGTHCSGTVTGQGDNGVGVAGVSWNSRVMGLKFLCANGSGSTYAAALAVRYAVDMKATLTSNSWGGGGFSQALYDTILYAQSHNQLFVAAAGNAGTNLDASNSYPAGYDLPSIVSVAASDASDAKASFSNYGATRVDLAAPGVGILSTLPGNSYAAWSGTSMAAPHVSGALALYYAAHPNASWSDARAALLAAVDPVAAWRGVVATGGRLNVGRLLATAAPPPPAPTGVQAVVDGADGLRVSWSPSSDSSVTHYLMYARVDGGELRPAQRADASPAKIGPVGVGVWRVSVAAVNPGGIGPRSAEAVVILSDLVPPGRILDVTVRSPRGNPVDPESAVATSDFGEGWDAPQIMDGDPLTGWATQPEADPDDARLWLELGAHTRLGRVEISGLPGFEAFFPPGLELRALAAGRWTVVASELEAPAAGTWSWDLAPFDAERLEIHVTEFASHESGLLYAVLGEVSLYAPPAEAASLVVAFTAPGDDGSTGRATAYDVRVAEGLTEAGFAAAPRFLVDPPAPAGQREQRTLGGLPSGKTLGVSVAAVDERDQRGGPSTVVFATTGAVPPGAPREPGVVQAGLDFVELRWLAPADDGDVQLSGKVAAYEIRWADRPITSVTWPDALRLDGPAPVAPGTLQQFTLRGLPASPRHHLRIAAIDHARLRGPWSADLSADAPPGPDHTPPASVRTLTATYESVGTEPLELDGEPALVDGDPETGWMQDAVSGETISLLFSLGPTPVALTRLVLSPHPLWPGDAPVAAAVRTFEPATGLWTERARVEALAPGVPLVLDMAPVEGDSFTLDLTVGPPRFGVAVVALAEVEAERALPGGGRARLAWVAPGDDGFLGRAVAYDLRMGASAIDSNAAFAAATELALPAPAEGGSLEVASLPGLGDSATLFFSLRARDDAGAWGPLGNSARLDVPPTPPAAVRDLRVLSVEREAVVLAFTAPGDDGDIGRATRYDLRRVEGAMTPARFAAAEPVPTPAPAVAGTAEQVRVEGLRPGTTYGFGLVAVDEVGAVGALGALVTALTVEATPPSNVVDLRAEAGPAPDRALLRWTAPGDDGAAGRASAYVLRVSEAPLTADNFNAALPIATSAPQLAGSAETAAAPGLALERSYYFGLTAADEQGNLSGLSNVARYDTAAQPPAPIADLRVAEREADALVVAFTATGDDGVVGQATAYDLRWSLRPISTEADFLAATRAATPAPQASGRAESVRVGGLPGATRIHLAILARDDRGAASPRSASVSGDTLDRTAPARVLDLHAAALSSATALNPVYAAASSSLLAQTGAASMIDENPSSVWLSALHDTPSPEWLVLDLGTPTFIDHLILRPAPGYASQFPADLRVDVGLGEAGERATLILDEVGLTVPEDGALDRRFAPVETRWLRLFTPTGMPFGAQGLVAVGAVEVFAADAGLSSVALSFTAPADIGPTGRVQTYDIRVALNLIEPATPAVFDAARALGGPIAQPPGLPQAFTATDLAPETHYGFALVATDADGNRSAISNVARVSTRGIPPSTIVDLRAETPEETALTLRFTAPSDAGAPAARYEMRRALAPLNAENFAQATVVPTPAPSAPGTAETLRVTGLPASTNLWFAVRSVDAGGSTSALSNVLAVRTADPPERVAPARILDLRAATVPDADGALALTFTAPGDDGTVGRATGYDLRWSFNFIDEANFAQATAVPTPVPLTAGSIEQRTVSGLPGERTIHFAIRAVDDLGNVASVSNDAAAATRAMPPSTIADLRIAREDQTAILRWTAPGADRSVGRASRYEVFVETRPFVSAAGLTPRADAPVPQPAGAAEAMQLADRPVDATTYAAVRAIDEVGNVGALSPVVSVLFPDTVPPAAPEATTLRTGDQRGTVRLVFRAPGDDGFTGRATRFEVAWSEATFARFDAGTPYVGFLSVVPGGAAADLILSGLPDERPVFVAVRAVDNAGQAGAASAVVTARTPEVAPDRVADLRATSAGADAIDLSWSAPGDDGMLGRAARYEVRRAEAALVSEATWTAATVVPGAPVPADPRAAQTLRVTGLRDGRTCFFALRTIDDRGNVSSLSNSASATTDDTTAPAAVADLRVAGEPGRPDALRLHWTAAGDDGREGTARRIDVRIHAGAGAWPGWLGATLVPFNFAPGAAGTAQSALIGGLLPETRYTVALASVDEVGNAAQPSNVASGETGDVPPGAPTRLAVAPDGPGALRLAWVAPADNGADVASGPVARYELVVADHEISTFDGLPLLAGPAPVAPGDTQLLRLTGLADDTPFWVLIRAVDDSGNVGPAAPVVTAATPDVAAPARVVTLVAQPPRTDADALLTGAAQASATLSAAWPADAAFDGDPDSAWAAPPSAAGEPPRLTVALDGRPRLGGLRLFVGAWPDQFPTAFDLSLDGHVVAHFEGLEPAADQWIELAFEPDAAASVTLTITEVGDANGYVVVPEVEVLPADDPPDSLLLSWVAPGDNADRGTARRYDLRVSSQVIDAANFAAARSVAAPVPAPAGRPQSVRVSGLSEDTVYHFALVTLDDAANASPLSNDASARTGGVPPTVVEDLTATPDGAGAVLLEWSAPRDEAGVAAYDLRYRPGALGDPSWAQAMRAVTPLPAAPGTPQRARVDGLLPGTGYAFGLRAQDTRGFASRTSNLAYALTAPGPDASAPSAVTELRAHAVAGNGRPLVVERISASGAQFPDLPPTATADGDPATAWATPVAAGAGEEWITFTLPTPIAVDRVRLRAAPDLADLFPRDFVLEVALDGLSFTRISSVVGHVADPARAATFAFAPTPVRDLRIRAQRPHRANQWLVVMAEVELFEAAAPDAVTLTFLAPGDDGDVGRATAYRVGRAATPLTEGNWAGSTLIDAALEPLSSGAPQAIVLTGLPAGHHAFAVRALDEVGHLGPVGASVVFDVR